MPCIKCSNGKWKYGEHGSCQFDTLKACEAAAAAIHAKKGEEPVYAPQDPCSPLHDPLCQCYSCKACKN